MRVLVVANLKGGVGKSTLSAALAVRACDDFARVAVLDIDSQRSLARWLAMRTVKDRPEVMAGDDMPGDAVEKLRLDGWDIVVIDTPPSHFERIEEAIEVADLVLIPLRPSMPDLASTSDTVALVRKSGKPMLAAINDAVRSDKAMEAARELLVDAKVPLAETVVFHRVSHMRAFSVGKSAAETRKDAAAAEEVDALWREIAAVLRLKLRGRGQK